MGVPIAFSSGCTVPCFLLTVRLYQIRFDHHALDGNWAICTGVERRTMAQDEHISRRRMLQLTGVAASTALVAGCGGGGGNGGNGGNGGGGGGIEIEPGTAIEFDGQTSGWEGLAPSAIEGEVNPTLVLQEGETYEIGWTVGDGAQHNIEIRKESDEVVDGLQTEVVTEPEDQWLEFEASPEM